MQPLVVFVVFGSSMLLCDVARTLNTALIAHGRGFLGSIADICADLCTLVSIGGGATVALHGSKETVTAVVAGIAIGSLLGTQVGVRADRWIERRFPKART